MMGRSGCLEGEEGPGAAGQVPGRDLPEPVLEPPEELGRWREQRWGPQWQEFLQSLEAPHYTQTSPPELDATPWGDAKAFLASFEQVAVACGWPPGEWVARLLPALSGGAQQAFSLLAAPEREDYGQVKAAILRGEALRREKRRQHFRQFCCPQLGDPQRMYSQVQELCCQWLKPERHSKEHILELLVLEQFLAGLPEDAQRWVRARGPDGCAQALTLLKDFMMSQRETDRSAWQEPLQEWALGPLEVKVECVDTEQVEISREPAEIFRDSKPHIKEEASSLGIEKVHIASVLPQEDQDIGEDELSGAPGDQVEQEMNPREMGMQFHEVEQAPGQSSQQTTFWKVLQQDENEGSLDDGLRTWLHGNSSQLGGKGLEGAPRIRQGRTPEDVPVRADVLEEGCESNREKGTEPLRGCKESGKHPDCRQNLFQSSSFSRHQMISTEEQSLWYPECGEELSLRSYLLSHESNPTEVKSHKCPECGKRFTRRSGLWKHQIIHTGKKPHQCLECGKSFTWRSSLISHLSTHTGVKPHQCLNCGRSFSQRSHLLRHQTIHTGEKPHKCQNCGRRFSRRSHLLRHQTIHTQG